MRQVAKALYEDDIFICPVRVGSGVRNKILEAFACGMTVVSTSIGAEGIAARHGEEIWIEDDPAKFSEAVVNLAESPALRREIGAKARRFVERNYSSRILEELESTYFELSKICK